jgi:hypothetical protein
MLNKEINGKNAMLIGPGRWGSTTASLGVPVRFAELCNMTAICEVASVKDGFMPELSYGCHFFRILLKAASSMRRYMTAARMRYSTGIYPEKRKPA